MSNDELGKMLIDCHHNGTVSSAILKAVETIARGYLASAGGNRSDDDDIVQAVLINFSRSWRAVAVNRNIFAYITSMTKNERKMLFRRAGSRPVFVRNSETYYNNYVRFSIRAACQY